MKGIEYGKSQGTDTITACPIETMPDSLPGSIGKERNVYQTGTLQYSLTGLIVLSFWLIWGDFCLVML